MKKILLNILTAAVLLSSNLAATKASFAMPTDREARKLLRNSASTEMAHQIRDLCNPDVLATMTIVSGLCSGMNLKLTGSFAQASLLTQLKLSRLTGIIPSNLAATFAENFNQCAKKNGTLESLFNVTVDFPVFNNPDALLGDAASCATNTLKNMFGLSFNFASLTNFQSCLGSFASLGGKLQAFVQSIQGAAGKAILAFSQFAAKFEQRIASAGAQCLPNITGPQAGLLAEAMGLANGTLSAFQSLKNISGITLKVSGIVSDAAMCVAQAAGQIQPISNLGAVLSAALGMISSLPATLNSLQSLAGLFKVSSAICPQGISAGNLNTLRNACAKSARLSKVRGVPTGAPVPFGWNVPDSADVDFQFSNDF